VGGFFLCTVPPCGYTLATTTRQYGSLFAHGPPAKTAGGLFVFMRSRSRRCPAGTPSWRSLPPKGGHAHLSAEALSGQRSPPRHVSTCRLRLTPLERNARGTLSFFLYPPRMWLARSPGPPKGRHRLVQSPPARIPSHRTCCAGATLSGSTTPSRHSAQHSRTARCILYVSDESGYGI